MLPLDYLAEAGTFARKHNLKLHLDGARVFNAAIKLNVSVQEISQHFDTISICLSKGLGAPVGSVLCGSRECIKEARRWRKVLGGGMRQAGILAAAGIYALTEHVDRLAEDHTNAAILAEGLGKIDELDIDPCAAQTNMVFFSLRNSNDEDLQAYLKNNGILITLLTLLKNIRLVTHLDVNEKDIHTTVEKIKAYFTN